MMDALDDVLDEIQQLLDAQKQVEERRREGEGNFRCVRCNGCNECRFCVDCTDCDDCTYCESCTACTGCTQSKACRDCQRTSHSFASRACDACSYVTLCVGCEECVHCFACVGLAGAEFCILNEKLSRKDYQARVAELKGALERRLADGWLPPWLQDEPEPAPDAPTPDELDELLGFDDLDGIAAPLPRDPLEQARQLGEPALLPELEPSPPPRIANEPARIADPGPAPRSVVRAARPARPSESSEPPAEPASIEPRSRVLVARRPTR
jgi:hypothetical protein